MLHLPRRQFQRSALRQVTSVRLWYPRSIMTSSESIEEETLPGYRPEAYYPVFIGQVLDERYKILAKLGFGGESTIWLAQNITKWRFQNNRFVTLKIHTVAKENDPSKFPEVKFSEAIIRADPAHDGLRYLRTVLESFTIRGQSGHHLCLAYAPMRETLSTFQRRLKDGRIPVSLLKPLLRFLLLGLDYLHTKCRIIHTDLKPDNILIGIEDDQIVHDLIQQEVHFPSPSKILGDRRIYPHRNFGDFKSAPGRPKIGDFGLAVQAANNLYYHPIQPDCLQAPEVILRAGWSYSADIWNFGAMIWDLLEGQSLFHAQKPGVESYAPEIHLAEMIAILNTPPPSLLQRGKSTGRFFTPDGGLVFKDLAQPRYSGLEDTVSALSGEDKMAFLQFTRKMLRWVPEERATARELLSDPWLCS